MPELKLAINGAFCTRRWEEPENWMRITRELGYPYHEFCGDVIDPFFSGDREYQMRTARAVKAAAAKYGVGITDIYTGVATHRFHGLSHSDPACRKRMKQWITDCMDLALEMGTDAVGGHWDAFSVEVLSDAARTREAWDRLCDTFRELAIIAKDKGLRAIYQEQMYVPSEVPWTIEQAYRFLTAVNTGNQGVPVRLTVDVGHQAGMHYGATGEDLDYVAWLEHFAAVADIIHLQQTTPDASHHWAFTPEYNERGHIRMEKVMAAIQTSHCRFADSPLAACMEPVQRSYLVAEIIPGSTKTEERLLEELKVSAEYLKAFVPDNLSF
jgi:sugar phosphate isomerase/epimerase